MTGDGGLGRRGIAWLALLVTVLLVLSTGVDVVIGTGDSMEPRYESCDLLVVDTVRDTAGFVHVGDVIAYRSGSGLIVHEVVGVDPGDDYVWARGVNRDVRDRVPSEKLVGVVVAHLDTARICSTLG